MNFEFRLIEYSWIFNLFFLLEQKNPKIWRFQLFLKIIMLFLETVEGYINCFFPSNQNWFWLFILHWWACLVFLFPWNKVGPAFTSIVFRIKPILSVFLSYTCFNVSWQGWWYLSVVSTQILLEGWKIYPLSLS